MAGIDSTDATGSTRTVERALALVGAISEQDGATLTELADRTGLSPSTASRLLATLVQLGFSERDAGNRYRAGRRLKEIAAITLREEPLYELAGPALHDLAHDTGETASLAIPVDDERALYLRQVAGHHRVQTSDWTGRTIPRHGTAIGEALAGRVDEHGVAATRVTVEPDITAVAAPIFDRHGAVVGAVNVIAPTYRTSDEDVAAHGVALVRHAARISALLGAPTPTEETAR
jgi:DNA-binding IclR family transcriptional regulator